MAPDRNCGRLNQIKVLPSMSILLQDGPNCLNVGAALKCIYFRQSHPETKKFAFSSSTCDEGDTMNFANTVGPDMMR
jgi:hypothetical protein